ncbi:MAG TPA: 4Fe-4S binding protein [Polyangia bacterium]|nr:4Fe-4S binding protein [Polyangia bacterium]
MGLLSEQLRLNRLPGRRHLAIDGSEVLLELNLQPDWLVLSTGIAPGADNPIFSGLLRTTLTADGFFLEAHPKLRPVDLANEGEYLAGLAHSPRFIDETIAHAKAVAGRAATILSRAKLDIAGQVAKVDPEGCVACATCVKVCPYGTPMINDLKKAHLPLPSSPAPSSAGMLLEEIANFNLQGLSQFYQCPHSR